jgi:hypothetical protein
MRSTRRFSDSRHQRFDGTPRAQSTPVPSVARRSRMFLVSGVMRRSWRRGIPWPPRANGQGRNGLRLSAHRLRGRMRCRAGHRSSALVERLHVQESHRRLRLESDSGERGRLRSCLRADRDVRQRWHAVGRAAGQRSGCVRVRSRQSPSRRSIRFRSRNICSTSAVAIIVRSLSACRF